MKTLCDVYKSPAHEDMYLYVDRADGLTRVPDGLLERFRTPRKVLTFVLTADRNMAREDPKKVMENLAKTGYHLQLPPLHEDRLAEFRAGRERPQEQD